MSRHGICFPFTIDLNFPFSECLPVDSNLPFPEFFAAIVNYLAPHYICCLLPVASLAS